MNKVLVYYSVLKDLEKAPDSDKNIQKQQIQYLLREGFMDLFGIEYLDEDVIRDHNGKPRYEKAPNVFFNISHCPGLVAVAFSCLSVGVDAEHERRIRTSTAFRVCSVPELKYIYQNQILPRKEASKYLEGEENSRFIKLWTMKESHVKQSGIGLRISLQQISFPVQFLQDEIRLNAFSQQEGITTCRYDLSPWHLSVSVDGQILPDEINLCKYSILDEME